MNGEVFTSGAGRVARFFIGMTSGYSNPRLTIEDVAGHIGEIMDEAGYTVPAGPEDEFKAIEAAAAQAAAVGGRPLA